jgi:hypothetical protein
LFEVPYFHCSRIINFLIDTGSSYSAITEKESDLLGIEYAVLPDAPKGAIGFGGKFKNKMINRPVYLTFKYLKEEYKMTYSSGFQIVIIPATIVGEDREEMFRYTPSVLGIDVLSKFQLYLDKEKVELTLVKD